jgi:hypothetical protein
MEFCPSATIFDGFLPAGSLGLFFASNTVASSDSELRSVTGGRMWMKRLDVINETVIFFERLTALSRLT